MDTFTGSYPPGDLRASDADRDRALAELSGHFQAGRLTAAEFDERTGQALRARTGGELTALLSDLPSDPPIANSTAGTAAAVGPVDARPRRSARLPMWRIALLGFAIAAGVSVATDSHGDHHVTISLLPILLVAFGIRYLARAGWCGRRQR